ncbi:hypothetical protein [Enterovibrio norvegicus]|uniref:hypothetical protein n=1 Tax=Enterovibrio norvegicus TaxID=188144 RepID=UPI00352BE071
MNLYDYFLKVQNELGGSVLTVYPAIDADDDDESVWVIMEGKDGDIGSRHILWCSISKGRDISEDEEPVYTSCPLFFFELVPLGGNDRWREKVRWFWEVLEQGGESDQAWEAYGQGLEAFDDQTAKADNPYPVESFFHKAWLKGWQHRAELF